MTRIAMFLAAALFCAGAAAQDSTDFVKQAQERLKLLGFYEGPVNGDFGPYTQAALAQRPRSRSASRAMRAPPAAQQRSRAAS